jgi:hypothetical protein
MASPANSTASSSGGGVGESPQLSSPPVARQTRHLVEHRVERQRSVESIVPIRPHLQHPEPLPGPLNAEQASSNRVPSSDSGNAASRSGPVGARYGNRLPYGVPGRRVGRKMKRPTAPVPVVASSRSPWPPPSHGTRSASPKMSGRNFGNPVARDRRSTTRSPQAHQSSQHWSLLHSPAEQPSPDERPLEDGGPSCVEYAMPPPHRKRLPAPYQQGLPERHPCAALDSTLTNRKVPAARGSFRVTWGPLPCQGRLSCTSKSVATGAECGRVRWRSRDIASIGWQPGCRRTTSWK